MARKSNVSGILILLSFWLVPTQLLVSAALGGATRQRDLFGQLVWVEVGQISANTRNVFLVSMAATLLSLIRVRRAPEHSRSKIQALQSKATKRAITVLVITAVLTFFSMVLNLSAWSAAELLKPLLFFVILFAVIKNGLPPWLPKYLTLSAVFWLFATVIFSLFAPEYSVSPCRPDKCSVLGVLYNSFLPHENFLAMLMLAILPLLSGLKNRYFKLVCISIDIFLIVVSGARVAYLALVVLALLLLMRRLRLLIVAPPILIVLSVLVLYTTFGDDLTGRGFVYAFVRQSVAENLWFGSGPNTLSDAYFQSKIVFLAYHDHGVAPTLLDKYGVLVSTCFFLALAISAKVMFESKNVELILFGPFSMVALTFASETSFDLDVTSISFWAFLMFVASALGRFDERSLESSASKNTAILNLPLRLGK